jgi:hypothetical protein
MRTRKPKPAFVELEGRVTPTFWGNQLLPLDNPWNQKVTNAPVSTNSAAIIAHLGTSALHPDFGNPLTDGALYGIPVNVVDNTVPKVPIVIGPNGYAGESDPVLVPVPANPVIEGDGPTGPASPLGRGDSHMLIYDKSANVLYETYLTARPMESSFPTYSPTDPPDPHTLGAWGAYQLSKWDLNTDTFRPLGWTSADAAGLPIVPGLARPDEALPASAGGQGVITHAIRFTVQQTLDNYVYPASHEASSNTATNLPRMGERFRLNASFVIPTTWAPEVQAVAQAMKDYGLIVADNGSNMYFQGVPSTQWNMDSMLMLRAINASDFDVVDLTPIVTGLSTSSGSTAGGGAITVTGQNFSGAAGNLHVLFGTTEAAFTIISDTQLTVTVPAHAAGTVDVRVQSGSTQTDSNGQPRFFGYGMSAATPADSFTFGTSPPTSPPPPPPNSPPPAAPATLVGSREFAAGNGLSGAVNFYNPDGSLRFTSNLFPGFTGGVRVASADFNGDGVADLVVSTGPGSASHVVVLDGKDQHLLFSIDPFEPSFTGGVFVAAGDLTGDGLADLVITPDQGGGPRVRIFRGGTFTQLNDFWGIDDPNFHGGARAAVGDINGDGKADLAVAAGFGGGPRVAL